MKLTNIRINPKTVAYSTMNVVDDATDKAHHQTEELPLPALQETLANLSSVCCKWMDCPNSWNDGIKPLGISISYTAAGTRSVSIVFDRPFEMMGEGTLRNVTPTVRIDKAADGEDKKPVATKAHVKLIEEFIAAAEDYANGKRAQGTLDQYAKAQAQPKDDGGEPLL